MSLTTTFPEIKNIDFVGNNQMVAHLDNGRALIIPLENFPSILGMNDEDKQNFEIIDGYNLSFLTLDEIFTIQELMGIRSSIV